jgi:hypothetical protein
VALPDWSESYRFVRRNLERIATSATLLLIVWQRAAITANFAGGDWSLSNFYSAVFNWSAIQVGFLFGAYAFFLSRSEPFIQAVAASDHFTQLRIYVKRTMYLTMALAALTAALLVDTPAMVAGRFSLGFGVFAVVSCVLIYTLFCMLKVIRVFGKLERPR